MAGVCLAIYLKGGYGFVHDGLSGEGEEFRFPGVIEGVFDG